jgi:hypothetical protein
MVNIFHAITNVFTPSTAEAVDTPTIDPLTSQYITRTGLRSCYLTQETCTVQRNGTPVRYQVVVDAETCEALWVSERELIVRSWFYQGKAIS